MYLCKGIGGEYCGGCNCPSCERSDTEGKTGNHIYIDSSDIKSVNEAKLLAVKNKIESRRN